MPWAFRLGVIWMKDGSPTSPAFYTCRRFDEETRRCTSHDDLPETCAGYPWFDGEPNHLKLLAPECSYNADVGRTVAVALTRKPGGTGGSEDGYKEGLKGL